MAGRFVRSSKYRHVFGRPTRKEQCYDNLHISRNAWDTNLVKVNPQYISVNWETSGGGAFAVLPTNETGRLPERFPLFRGHTAVVLDTDWNPFNDSLIASGSDDGKVFLWRVPENFTLYSDAEQIEDISPMGKLSGHPRKVGHVLFNPAAENVLASSSGDFTVKIWDIESGSSNLTLKHGEVIQSLSWSANGSMLVTTSRDKKLRFWDVRQERAAHETAGHSGAKSSRAVWMGEHDRVATTGFSKMSDRQLALWDIRAPIEPIGGFKSLDSISGVCMPFWDEGTQCLYLAGKGDGNIRYFEYENDKFEYLSEYQSADPQRGVGIMPKRGVNMHENEVVKAFKTVNDTYIEPISFIVPRRAEMFQDDIYPPTTGLKPAMSSGEWFAGKEGLPPKIDMESLYGGEGLKEISSKTVSAPKATPSVKASKNTTKEPESRKPAPATVSTVTPPSVQEQASSVANMVSKYADHEEKGEDGDDCSSFEEVQKPASRPSAITFSPPGVREPVVASKGNSKAEPPLTTSTPNKLSPHTPTADIPSGVHDVVQRELSSIRALVAEQGRTIVAQSQQIQFLMSEIEELKAKLS
ncbi:actin binding protein [Paracoccidioides lutzii Pb01]|uniref:Coronin n=1 Tax=Paracoccidioides lutzii (strain ATCC MYA-826 / Pb01) TaxID=502779 RepID=C1GNA9_PARBA|nr:actin binding protein [Paracoccidioides lutzii Pb01]EEH35681.1 actin binding protein [Paracoccidioides lutzii Pb01]